MIVRRIYLQFSRELLCPFEEQKQLEVRVNQIGHRPQGMPATQMNLPAPPGRTIRRNVRRYWQDRQSPAGSSLEILDRYPHRAPRMHANLRCPLPRTSPQGRYTHSPGRWPQEKTDGESPTCQQYATWWRLITAGLATAGGIAASSWSTSAAEPLPPSCAPGSSPTDRVWSSIVDRGRPCWPSRGPARVGKACQAAAFASRRRRWRMNSV